MKSLLIGASSAVFLTAAPALALTPAEFVEELKALYEAQGMNFELGEQETDGEAEVLRDFGSTIEDKNGLTTSFSVGEMRVAPTSDEGYEVVVTFPPEVQIVSTSSVDDETVEMAFTIASDGRYLVRRAGDFLEGLSEFTSLTVTLDSLEGGDDVPSMDLSVDVTDLVGTASYSLEEDIQKFDYTIGAMGYSVKIDDPEAEMDMSGTYADMTAKGEFGISNSSDPEAFLRTDEMRTMELVAASSDFSVDSNTPQGPFSISGKTGETALSFSFGKGQIAYSTYGDDVALQVDGGAIPFPVKATMARLESSMAMPLVPTGEPGEMAVSLAMADVEVDESLWGMFDPGQSLPREPATIELDVTSKASALHSLMDEDAMTAGQMPWEFEDVQLRNLRVSIAGAEITGQGSAVMNNAGPVPMPVGGIDLSIRGVNGLVGSLTEMGLLAPEQAMPVQMMLGMFAKPGSEPDTFTSRVEMTEEGGILANGIPLQ
ncbi:DUF2125 domain-containing protein [Algicella marina]|uniref:DUF2125 domain-containing protein n=1 Tax=Algicella marina TaxID=2683284 RepID=A0A6P1SYF5_9RHOB|nr:DUF2125 domain-containing protein [Algicella marina]QHQ34565.1 DUF2125 domain-containing protein [Algicella marina]